MSASKIASLAGLVAGTIWAVFAATTWGQDTFTLTDDQLWMVGVVGFVVTSGLVGYAVVDRAPWWLRLVVTLCAAALGYGLVASIQQAIDDRTLLAAGLAPVLLVASLVGLAVPDRRRQKPQSHRGGRRAAR